MLAKKAGLLRCGKSCRLRWMNYLRPSVKRGQIADDEEDLILRLHRLLGNRWSLIAGRIPGRTDNEIKNYWNTHLSKKLISQGIDPRTHKPLDPQSFDPSKPSLSKANLDVQHLANHFIASQGYTGLLTYDGASGMDLRGNQRLGIGEADDQDINSGTDDVFSFLNSLINEEAFQQHQILNVPHVNSTAPSSSDPFVSSTFGLGMTGWESPLMSLVDRRDLISTCMRQTYTNVNIQLSRHRMWLQIQLPGFTVKTDHLNEVNGKIRSFS